MTDEAKRDWVLAKCKELSESKDYSLPFHIERGTDPHSREYFEQGYSFVSGDGDLLFELTVDFLPSTTLNLAAILLGLPEEGKRQPAQLELIWERDEVGAYGWSGRSKFVHAEVSKNLMDIETFNWSASYNTSSERLSGNCPTLEEAIREAKQAATNLVTKQLSISSAIQLESLFGGKTALTIFRGIESAMAECAKNQHPIVTGFDVDIEGESVSVMRVFITSTHGEDPITRLEYWRDRALKAESSAPSPQPLVDALKEISNICGNPTIHWVQRVGDSGDIANAVLKDWEGKQ